MKQSIIAAGFVLMFVCNLSSYDPPRGLSWIMKYSEVVISLKNDRLDVKKLKKDKIRKGYREYPELARPDDYFRVEVKKAKVGDKKCARTYLLFDADTTLTSWAYLLKWDNDDSNKGARKCWVAHADLKAALVDKYGTPTVDEVTELTRSQSIPSGTKYRVRWVDSTGSSVNLLITRQTHNAVIATIDAYFLFLIYNEYETTAGTQDSSRVRDDI